MGHTAGTLHSTRTNQGGIYLNTPVPKVGHLQVFVG